MDDDDRVHKDRSGCSVTICLALIVGAGLLALL